MFAEKETNVTDYVVFNYCKLTKVNPHVFLCRTKQLFQGAYPRLSI